jgi:hypothetical protein
MQNLGGNRQRELDNLRLHARKVFGSLRSKAKRSRDGCPRGLQFRLILLAQPLFRLLRGLGPFTGDPLRQLLFRKLNIRRRLLPRRSRQALQASSEPLGDRVARPYRGTPEPEPGRKHISNSTY